MSYRQSHLEKSGEQYDSDLELGALDSYMTKREAEIISTILGKIHLSAQARCLDFACGSGRILSILSPFFEEIVAVDVSEKMLPSARQKVPKAIFHTIDLTTNNIDIGRFDLITAFRFFGNADDYLRRIAMDALRARIKDDGYLLINNHRNPSSLLAVLSGHKHGMNLDYQKLNALLCDHGFHVAKKFPIGTWILRHKWADRKIWNSSAGRIGDCISGMPFLVRFAPDMVLLCKPT